MLHVLNSNNPLRVGAYMSYVPNLLQINSSQSPLGSWSLEPTKLVVISSISTFSLTKWQINLLCAWFLWWKTELEAICSASWLSQISFISLNSSYSSCWSNCLNHGNSYVAAAMTGYSAFELDLETMFCLLFFHEIKLSLTKTIPLSGSSIRWWSRLNSIGIGINLSISSDFVE